jgi:hypothetical protein
LVKKVNTKTLRILQGVLFSFKDFFQKLNMKNGEPSNEIFLKKVFLVILFKLKVFYCYKLKLFYFYKMKHS